MRPPKPKTQIILQFIAQTIGETDEDGQLVCDLTPMRLFINDVASEKRTTFPKLPQDGTDCLYKFCFNASRLKPSLFIMDSSLFPEIVTVPDFTTIFWLKLA